MTYKATFLDTAWDWDEISARNCCHCKVFSAHNTLFACCELGCSLSLTQKTALKDQEDKGRKCGATYSNILRLTKHMPKACRDCSDFEHDVPVK